MPILFNTLMYIYIYLPVSGKMDNSMIQEEDAHHSKNITAEDG